MTRKSGEDRLAAALKENLKRRKAQARATGAPETSPKGPEALGTAPQTGLNEMPDARRPKAARKRL